MIRKKMRLVLALAILALAVGVVAASAQTRVSGGAQAQKLTHLDVGLALIPPKMTFVGFYVARDMGFFKKQGLDVNLEGFDGGVKSLRGVASGTVDMGATSADDVIAAATQGGGVKAIWSYDMPLDTTLVADQSVQSLADLAGKKIGITDPGGFADVQARAVLALAHLTPDQVQIISLPSRSALLPALVSGRINAAPFHVDDGYAAREQDPSLHPLQAIYKALPLWWYGSIAVTNGYAKKNAAVIERFIAAMDKADRWMYGNPAKTIAIGVKYTQESLSTVTQAYQFLAAAHAWTVNAGLEKARVVSTMQHEFQFKEIPSLPAYGDVANLAFANAALKKIGKWPAKSQKGWH
ncbi:MAG: ABC transporter substrate-binding protein [Gaiellaceae bacterium]